MSPKASPRFWNWMARRYSRQPIADEEAYRRKLDITRHLLRADMKILEFGCGTGSTALIHAPLVAHVDAIDFSDRMIAIAERKAGTGGTRNVTFRTSTIEDWQADRERLAPRAGQCLHRREGGGIVEDGLAFGRTQGHRSRSSPSRLRIGRLLVSGTGGGA